jgi:bifunctional non-homologous end joining protein LigD
VSATEDDELRLYREKRDPGATNEPFEVAKPSAGATWAGDFVVHLHDATRRHYDVRLQVGGILKSFAVPRGPSLSPAEKRLAVQTEDHPLSYLDFEDVIPDDNYGAGPMIVWDIGRIRYLENPPELGIPKGKLDFELQGRKLRGRFALVETTERFAPKSKQRQWLMLKKQDVHCVPEPGPVETQPQSVLSGLTVEQLVDRPKFAAELLQAARALGATELTAAQKSKRLVPMLSATEGAELDDPRRLYELKLDGVRVLAARSGDRVSLTYRSGRSATESFPELSRALQTLYLDNFVLDGEIVAFNERGRPEFQRLAKRFSVSKPFEVKVAMAEVSAVFLAFDVLRLGNLDVTQLPLIERKSLLAKLVTGKGLVRYLDHISQRGKLLFELCEKQGLEGVISKLETSRYLPGERTLDWVKHKREEEESFVVVGWVKGKGHRIDLGALELGSYRGETLVYRGRVGSGFNDQELAQFVEAIASPALAADQFHCIELPDEGMNNSIPLQPRWVVRVRFLEWTPQRRLRMAVYLGWDKAADPRSCDAAPRDETEQRAMDTLEREVTLAQPERAHATEGEATAHVGRQSREAEIASLATNSDATASKVTTGAAVRAAPRFDPLVRRRVVLTNLDKVFWPDEGFTKGQLLQYYEAIAPWLLPHLEQRPVMLVRYPDGVAGKSFYQWNVPAGTPDWVRTLTLREEEKDGKDVVTFLVDSVDSLLHIINLGCIPIHVLAARMPHVEFCDFLTIDFDLGDHPFSLAVRMALELRQLLTDVGLVGYPKTSGQSGLHVLIPLGPRAPFPMAKGLVELLGRLLQRRFPDEATMERRINKRSARAYIDTGQTGRSRTIVGPYSVRAHPGARVSTPLHWDEVHLALRPDRYTMFTVPELLTERGDPLAGWLDAGPDLVSVLGKLERWVRP